MQSSPLKRYQQLQPEDRGTLASLVRQNLGVREIALTMGRSASIISRELLRNAQPAGSVGATEPVCAQRRRNPPNKPHPGGLLFVIVRH